MRIEGRAVPPRRTEFHLQNPENHIVVENRGERVFIRATEGNFSTRRKLFFIRHIAAEGYIPVRFERIAFEDPEDFRDLIWLVNRPTRRHRHTCSRFSDRLMFGLLGLCVLGWLVLIALTYLPCHCKHRTSVAVTRYSLSGRGLLIVASLPLSLLAQAPGLQDFRAALHEPPFQGSRAPLNQHDEPRRGNSPCRAAAATPPADRD
jgi:hypothetical protein